MGINLRYGPMDWDSSLGHYNFNGAPAVGVGNAMPTMGKTRYLVVTKAEANVWYKYLTQTHGISPNDIYSSLALAYADMTAGQNDVLYVAPGAHNQTATLDWTKNNTHLIGLGGPNNRADYSEGNTVIYTATALVDWTIHLTGNHCQFYNIGINNAGANAGNFGPLYVDGYNNYFENCSLIGNMAAQQLADDDCASLHIGTNAHNCKWINCDIGEDCWGARSAAYSGQISFIGSNPNGGLFKGCAIRSQSVTAGVSMVTVYKGAAGTTHIGRGWVFDNCTFMNFAGVTGETQELTRVFYIENPAGDNSCLPILLKDCSAFGFHTWNDYSASTRIWGTMPGYDDSGGLACRMDDTNE